jgi:hypothetical protein
MTRILVAGFCALALCAASGPARAALFFVDQFAYANGDLTDLDDVTNPEVITDGGGANVSGGAWKAFSGTGFAAESITVVNGQAELLISGSEDASRSVSPDFQQAGETWYFAARITVNDQRATPGSTAIVNEYFMLLKDNTDGGLRSRLYVNNPSTGTGGAGYRLAMGASSGAGNAVNWGSDLSFGTTYTVVGSYEFSSGAAKLWVNPASEASTSITAAAGASAMTFISELGLRQAFSNGGVTGGPSVPNTQILVSVAAMGDSFADVLAAVVPEPGSATLGLSALVGQAGLRRRRG